MNNLLKSSFLVGFLLISASFMSKDKNFSLNFGVIKAKTINFEISNAQDVSLIVYNDYNDQIYSEKISTDNNVSKSYDFETLSVGTYYLIAESDYKVEKYKISINKDNQMVVDKTPLVEINKPEYTIAGNIVKMHISNLAGSANVSVKDLSDNVYYSVNKTNVDGKLDITFDLNPKTADTYLIVVEKDGNVFNKIISLK